jgi:hypothetical protein
MTAHIFVCTMRMRAPATVAAGPTEKWMSAKTFTERGCIRRLSIRKIVSIILLIITLTVGMSSESPAEGERNILTFINHSGNYAMVKLMGPTRSTVTVQDNGEATVNIAGGKYVIYVRYGKKSPYRYTKGESFAIEDSSLKYTKATLTLHGVVNGNYRTAGSSEEEFNRK